MGRRKLSHLPAFVWTFSVVLWWGSQRTSTFGTGNYNSSNCASVTPRWSWCCSADLLDHMLLAFAIMCNQYQSILRASPTEGNTWHLNYGSFVTLSAKEESWFLQLVSFLTPPVVHVDTSVGFAICATQPKVAPGFRNQSFRSSGSGCRLRAGLARIPAGECLVRMVGCQEASSPLQIMRVAIRRGVEMWNALKFHDGVEHLP